MYVKVAQWLMFWAVNLVHMGWNLAEIILFHSLVVVVVTSELFTNVKHFMCFSLQLFSSKYFTMVAIIFLSIGLNGTLEFRLDMLTVCYNLTLGKINACEQLRL